jgi:hypothetical protein
MESLFWDPQPGAATHLSELNNFLLPRVGVVDLGGVTELAEAEEGDSDDDSATLDPSSRFAFFRNICCTTNNNAIGATAAAEETTTIPRTTDKSPRIVKCRSLVGVC